MKKIIAFLLIVVISVNTFVVNSFAYEVDIEQPKESVLNQGKVFNYDDIQVMKKNVNNNEQIQLVKTKNNSNNIETYMIIINNNSNSKNFKYNLQSNINNNFNIEKNEKMNIDNIIEKDLSNNNYFYYNRIDFAFFPTEDEATNAYNQITSNKVIDRMIPYSRSSFFHGSYIEDYYSWAGHGYHVHLSSRDASYITSMGWLSADSIAGALAALGIISVGVAVLIGFIVTASVLTLYWIEQNNDASLDIWSPDKLRNGIPGFGILPGTRLGTVKVGRHWYPINR